MFVQNNQLNILGIYFIFTFLHCKTPNHAGYLTRPFFPPPQIKTEKSGLACKTIQRSGYLKFSFSNACSNYGTKQLLSSIDRGATKVQVDAHLQKSLPGKGIPLKTTQIFLTIFWELYSVVFKPIYEDFIFPVSKIF